MLSKLLLLSCATLTDVWLVDQPGFCHLFDILEISLCAILSEHFAVLDKDQEAENLDYSGSSCHYKTILIPFQEIEVSE